LETIVEHLGANYVLSGAYVVANDRIALQLELADSRSHHIVWSERTTDNVPDVLRGNQELINRVATQVYTAVAAQELQRARSQPLPTLESYTLLMSAIALMHRRAARDFLTAREMLQAVIDRSPRQSVPLAWLAKWYVLRIQQGMTDNAKRDAAEAMRCTNQSLDLDPESSLALAIDGLVHTHMTKRHDIADARYRSAVESNPNNALAWLLKGAQHAFTDDATQAISDTQRALRLSPLDPHSYYFHSLTASAYITAARNDLALEHAETSLRANRLHTSTLRVKAVAQWRLGLHAAARATASELRRLEPNLTISKWLRRSPSAPYKVGKEFARTLMSVGVPP
jgi:tetratricopeptide (TPR) repeat protein